MNGKLPQQTIAILVLLAASPTLPAQAKFNPDVQALQLQAASLIDGLAGREVGKIVDNVRLFSGASHWRPLPPIKWHRGQIVDAVFLPNGSLATVTPAGEVSIWNSQTGQLQKSLGITEPKVVKLLAAPGGTRLLGFTRSGQIHQWAAPLPKRGWGPEQAVGPPDSGIGDSSTAWASLSQDDQDEWLVLEFAAPVKAIKILVYENCSPGALVRVTTFGKDEKNLILWDGDDSVQTINGRNVSELKVIEPTPVKRIKLYIDSKKVPGWNEIDAVGLQDETGRIHWATSAGASSTYAHQGIQMQGGAVHLRGDVIIEEIEDLGRLR